MPLILNSEEKDWYERAKSISMKMDYSERIGRLKDQGRLFASLMDKKLIPQRRLRYLTQKELQTGYKKKSRLEIFEDNGTKGEEIFSHPHFLKYLRFFVEGPQVDEHILELIKGVISENFDEDDQVEEFIRRVKQFVPSPKEARDKFAQEVFKLAVDMDWDPSSCHKVRNKVMSFN